MAEITQRDSRRQAVAWLNDERIGAEIRRALPRHVDLDYFLRVAQTSILNNPMLASANKESLLRELVAVAQLGLVTDPQLGEAWLIVDGKGNVQRRVGYQGLRKLALQSGEVTALNAQVVYANDECEIELGDRPSVRHRVGVQMGDRGKAIGCYAIARIKGTEEPSVEWMSWPEIERHRDRYSDAYKRKSGPWADELAQHEMARKTVFRRLAKWMPKSPVLAEALADEDRADMRDVTPEPDLRSLPAPEDPMDRVVAEQRANSGAVEAPGEAPPSAKPQTSAEAPASPGAPTAPREPARRPGRPKKPETVAREQALRAREIIAELGSTAPEYVPDYLAERAAEIAELSAPWQDEIRAAARKREMIAASEPEPQPYDYDPETGEIGAPEADPDDSALLDQDERDDDDEYERWLQDMSTAMAQERREFLLGRKNQFLRVQPYGERGAAAVEAAFAARRESSQA